MVTRKVRFYPTPNEYATVTYAPGGNSILTKHPNTIRREHAMRILNELCLSDEEHIPIEDMIFSLDLENVTIAEEIIKNLTLQQ